MECGKVGLGRARLGWAGRCMARLGMDLGLAGRGQAGRGAAGQGSAT